MLLANTQTTIGGVILFAAVVIALTYAWINIRQGRAEVGSEIELAANRKPYHEDEVLEGERLTRTLQFGFLGMLVVAITLPLYWLNEPARQDGAVDDFNATFVKRGAALFDTTENGGYNCAFCHGGMEATGSVVEFTITDARGAFVKQVQWKAPALDTVLLRFSREAVRHILVYGRPGTPMPAWGVPGGGPLNEQQIQNLIDFMESIQTSREESQARIADAVDAEMAAAEAAGTPYGSRGEAMFNLGYYTNFAGGAYACARCHTSGWSYGEKGPDGDGAFGPSLRGGVSETRFPGAVLGFQQQVDFVCAGSAHGVGYGQSSQGTGKMPGFCQTPAEVDNSAATGEVGVEPRDASDPATEGGIMTKDDVEEIVHYVRGL